MNKLRATTVEQVQELELKFPSSPEKFDDEWRAIATMIDGYAVAKELGLDLRNWAAPLHQRYRETKSWSHLSSLLEIRLMLFYLQRDDYFSGYTYHECDQAVMDLFQAMSEFS